MPINDKPVKQPYEFQEFPKMVYGPDGEETVIANEDMRPDGYLNHPDDFKDDAADAAADAKAAAKVAAEEERDALKAFLDEHKVEYNANLGTTKLRGLSDALKEHLEKQDGAGK